MNIAFGCYDVKAPESAVCHFRNVDILRPYSSICLQFMSVIVMIVCMCVCDMNDESRSLS